MKKVVIKDWLEGMQKVAVTSLLRNEGGLTLAEAKQVTDDILDRKTKIIEMGSQEAASTMAMKLTELGLVCSVVDD
ncbi:MAG: hypothetical protein KIT41_11270 [Pyrinomonadaceae bacterium]|nr:hypothetical protein [Pyrinomonadaceae bacterium]